MNGAHPNLKRTALTLGLLIAVIPACNQGPDTTTEAEEASEQEKWLPPEDAVTCPTNSVLEVRENTSDLGQAATIEQRCVQNDGVAHGPFVIWSRDGLKQGSGERKNGIQQGEGLTYRRDGSIASRSVYLDGEVEEYFAYHKNGTKYLHALYENGKMNGLTRKWHPNGEKMAEGQMKDNAKDGPWVWWYEDGQLEKRGTLRAGRKIGVWEAWDRDATRREDTIHSDEAIPQVTDRD